MVSSAGSAPLSSAAARAAQPASVTWESTRPSTLSIVSPPAARAEQPGSETWVMLRSSAPSFVSTRAPAGRGGATRAARPSSPSGLPPRPRVSSPGSRRKAGARATSPASPMPILDR
eukprot:scaffold59884_cov23-Phaeocystis_antarctica.AAC.2